MLHSQCKQLIRVSAAALLAVPLLVVGPGGAARAQSAGSVQACLDRHSWLAGTVELCAGTLVYRDYLYDDYGADDPSVPQQSTSTTGSLSRPAGDERYDAANVNSADLVD